MLMPRLLLPAFSFIVRGFTPLYIWQIAAAGLIMQGASMLSSRKAGKAAAADAEEAWEVEQQMKLGAMIAQTDSLLASKQEMQDKTVDEMSEMTRQAVMTRGRISASAGESGLGGASVSQLFMTAFFEEARARGQQIYNLDKFNEQVNRDISAVQSGLQIGSRPAGYNSTGDALRFASSALSIANTAFGNTGSKTSGSIFSQAPTAAGSQTAGAPTS